MRTCLITPMTEEENELDGQEERLQKLAVFQLVMIKHAMKCMYNSPLLIIMDLISFLLFTIAVPAVKKIVYSTCSIHAAENEDVVCQALSSYEAQTGNFVLAERKDVLPTWERRGVPENMARSDAGKSNVHTSFGLWR